jgi:hypothetical protein
LCMCDHHCKNSKLQRLFLCAWHKNVSHTHFCNLCNTKMCAQHTILILHWLDTLIFYMYNYIDAIALLSSEKLMQYFAVDFYGSRHSPSGAGLSSGHPLQAYIYWQAPWLAKCLAAWEPVEWPGRPSGLQGSASKGEWPLYYFAVDFYVRSQVPRHHGSRWKHHGARC